MIEHGHKSDGIDVLYKPLPDLDGITFTNAVVKRTKRVQLWRKVVRSLTYLGFSAVLIATVPWRSVAGLVETIIMAVKLDTESAQQVSVWTEWMHSAISMQDIQTQQLMLTSALISLICASISFAMTEL